MTMQQRALPLLKNIFILSLIAVISACGGGGKKKDLIPNSFNFTAVTGAAVSAEVTSNTITVTSINKPVSISITGGTYAIGSGAYTGTTGTITNGQTVKVKVMTSASNSTAVTTTLTIGGVTGSFSVTTIAADATPDAFVLPPVTDVQPNSVNTSAVVTVAGINVAVPISVVGGEYSINGGTYTSAAGTVSTAQTVTVRTAAAAALSTAKDAVLTIGGVSATYTVTTIADTVAPTAQIMFPPPVSLSSGATLKIRGTSSDALSTISSVTVAGVDAVTTDNYATWTADVPLALGVNNIVVVTTDSVTNTNSSAATVSVTRVAAVDLDTARIPAITTNSFVSLKSMVLDNSNNRLLVLDADRVVSVNLLTGARAVVSDASTDTNNILSNPNGIVLDSVNNRVLVTDGSEKVIVAIDITDGVNKGKHSLISDCTSVDSTTILESPTSIALDTANNRVLIGDTFLNSIVAVGLTAGDCTVFSDAEPLFYPQEIALDADNGRALVADFTFNSISTPSLLSVNLSTGSRTVLSNNTTQATSPLLNTPFGMALDSVHNRLLVLDHDNSGSNHAIFSVNLTTGNREILSSTTIPNNNTLFKFVEGKMVFDATHNLLLVQNFDFNLNVGAIFAVDAFTGERVIISK